MKQTHTNTYESVFLRSYNGGMDKNKQTRFQCNVDRKGRMFRFAMSLILLVLGMALVMCWLVGMLPWWGWVAGGVILCLGVFVLFEASKGWCALRAMGIKTKI